MTTSGYSLNGLPSENPKDKPFYDDQDNSFTEINTPDFVNISPVPHPIVFVVQGK
ncbi:hypothetical protein SAMN03159284_00844 [Mucilaginibacter sp. NFR10]|nr:hypothetical protein SAMN03159284_00844 [Mucilaginibacter sp. NFR10]